jgi:hypothetical protein
MSSLSCSQSEALRVAQLLVDYQNALADMSLQPLVETSIKACVEEIVNKLRPMNFREHVNTVLQRQRELKKNGLSSRDDCKHKQKNMTNTKSLAVRCHYQTRRLQGSEKNIIIHRLSMETCLVATLGKVLRSEDQRQISIGRSRPKKSALCV